MARLRKTDPNGRARFGRMRERWHNASLKTSFMVYMLAFLVAALALSTVTASVFAALQNEIAADAYETSGIYLYDADNNALVPARSIAIDDAGNELFVERANDLQRTISLNNASPALVIESAQAYPYVYEVERSDENALSFEELITDSGALSAIEGPDGIAAQDVSAYDALAREIFEAWATARDDNPYRAFFEEEDASGTEGGSDAAAPDASGAAHFGELLVSPVGYYAHTEPSEEARVLSTVFGLLTFLMFPLWFGICIFAAARRFYRTRLAPGLTVLDDAAAKIADENLDFHVCYGRDDELGRLAASFEAMRSSLEQSQRTLWRTSEERKRLNAAFAHDLRTPLTILKGKVELLEARLREEEVDPERLRASAASLAAQVERLERYVAAMSGLQKLEDRQATRIEQPFSAMADDVLSAGTALCAKEGSTFELLVPAQLAPSASTLSIEIDRALVDEAVGNLLSNAARYAASRVTVRLDVRDANLLLVVEDDGPGFSADALEHGCAPFFSERKGAEHFGLGLNIAATLCERHGGSLELSNNVDGGACVQARFYVGPQTATAGIAQGRAQTPDAPDAAVVTVAPENFSQR